MRTVLVFVFAICTIAYAFPRPADDDTEKAKKDDPSSETEFVVVPLEKDQPRRPSFGFDLSLPDVFSQPRNPFGQDPFFRGSPFGQPNPDGSEVDDFMTQMQDMLREMRKQLTDLVQHAHEHGAIDGDNHSVGTRIGEDDLPQNKTTSTTKVIDGHVVTVNETTYSSGDAGVGAVFKVKIVEIHPSEGPETEAVDKSEEPVSAETPNTENSATGKSELDEDKHEETNEIPNPNQKVGSEVDDLLKA